MHVPGDILGNKKDLMTIWSKLPKDKGMQVVICSATLHSPEITELADTITQHPTCMHTCAIVLSL
jgi:superfamily II DNA/RNA helicase